MLDLQARSAVEVPSCPMCESGAFAVAFEEPPYRVCRCSRCQMVWVTPRLAEEELIELYGDGYWSSHTPRTIGYGDYRGDQELYLKTFRKRLEFALRDGPHGGRALDVGAAAGFCMKVLAELGFEVHGVEPAAAIARHASERLGLETVHVGTLDTAAHAPRSFDLITMWDVVEHVVDPAALLRKARELLKDDGKLVLETQNVDSAFARLLGPRWHHFKHAEHIYHFSPRTLRALLEASGFALRELTPRHAGKYVSPDFVAERSARLHPALSSALRPLARRLPGALYVNVMDEMVAIATPAA